MKELKNKTVFITGATAGIGKACAILFAKVGANLLLAARRIDKLKIFAEELRNTNNIKVKEIMLDVRNSQDVTDTP